MDKRSQTLQEVVGKEMVIFPPFEASSFVNSVSNGVQNLLAAAAPDTGSICLEEQVDYMGKLKLFIFTMFLPVLAGSHPIRNIYFVGMSALLPYLFFRLHL